MLERALPSWKHNPVFRLNTFYIQKSTEFEGTKNIRNMTYTFKKKQIFALKWDSHNCFINIKLLILIHIYSYLMNIPKVIE